MIMLEQQQLSYFKNSIFFLESPALSIYADINPGNPENSRKAWLLRVKNSLKELEGPPEELKQKVFNLLEQERPDAQTLVIFANDNFLERIDLQVKLPIVDLAHGRIEARWGNPYIIPLLYALDEYERTGVIFLDRKRWRMFEIYLNEIEEINNAFLDVEPEKWKQLSLDSVDRYYTGKAVSRGGADFDKFARRLEVWTYRFYKQLIQYIDTQVRERNIQRLILAGTEEETHFFRELLPKVLRDKVVACTSSLTHPDASPSEILDKVKPILSDIERKAEIALLQRVREEGVWSMGKVLETLQMGRLYVLVLPWQLDGTVWRCSNGWLSLTPTEAKVLFPNETTEEVNLRDALPETALSYGTRLEFVCGEAQELLKKDFGGVAGLLRW
jgi:hypothetical protein